MKARTNCTECRKRIYQEAETEYLKHEYKFFKDSAYSMAVYATVGVLAVMHRRGRSKQYIRQLFDDICFIYDYPEFRGKRLDMTEMMHLFETEYGIDFNKIKVHLESEKEFIKSVKER